VLDFFGVGAEPTDMRSGDVPAKCHQISNSRIWSLYIKDAQVIEYEDLKIIAGSNR
jgi:hypothetical protein